VLSTARAFVFSSTLRAAAFVPVAQPTHLKAIFQVAADDPCDAAISGPSHRLILFRFASEGFGGENR